MAKPGTQRNNSNGNNSKPSAQAPAQTQAPMSPEQVPWFESGYTFADRDRELSMLTLLLSEKLEAVRYEQRNLREQIRTRNYGLDLLSNADQSQSTAPSNSAPIKE